MPNLIKVATLVAFSVEVFEVIEDVRQATHSNICVLPSTDNARRHHLTTLANSFAWVRKQASNPRWSVRDFRTTFRTHAVRAREGGGRH